MCVLQECYSCHRYFNDQEKKHHCRACGEGFCDECTQYTKPVPERGWGPSPVRVCETCYNQPNHSNTNGKMLKEKQCLLVTQTWLINIYNYLLNISQTFRKPFIFLFLSVILLSLYPKAYLVAMILSLPKFDTRRRTTYILGVHQLNAFCYLLET